MTEIETAFLLDTNVISETRRSKKSRQVIEWLSGQNPAALHTTEINMAELTYGAQLIDDIMKRQQLEDWIENIIRPWLEGRILALNEKHMLRWLHLFKQAQKARKPAPPVDLIVASIALDRNMVVVTRDAAPFVACGVSTFNPFTGERFNGA